MDTTDKTQRVANCLREHRNRTLEDVVAWQRKLRQAVDELIIEKLAPAFNDEFNRRFEEAQSIGDLRNLTTWANFVLRDEVKLCVKSNRNGLPSVFVTQQARPSDPGRIYLVNYQTNASPLRNYTRVELPINVSLCPLPHQPSNLSRGR